MVLDIEDIVLPPKQWNKLKRDEGQIEEMRLAIERGEDLVPILVYKRREDSKYGITDGRHRYIAHIRAECGTIEAIIYD